MATTFESWFATTNDFSRERFIELVESNASIEKLESFLQGSYQAGYKECVKNLSEQEPEAWKHVMNDGFAVYYHAKDYFDPQVQKIIPVYGLPTARQPLSDKQIDMLTDRYHGRGTVRPQYQLYRAYVRAIEALHGIK